MLRPLVLMMLLLAALPAAAQTDGQGSANRQPLDANRDGVISRDEAQSRPGLARHFDQIDTNHDGQIDRSEFRAWRGQMKSRRAQRQQSSPAGASSGGGD